MNLQQVHELSMRMVLFPPRPGRVELRDWHAMANSSIAPSHGLVGPHRAEVPSSGKVRPLVQGEM